MKKTLLFILLFVIFVVCEAQILVSVDKGSKAQMDLLERLDLTLVYEMSDYIVLAVEDLSLLDEHNVQYQVLTMDNVSDPFIVAKDGVKEVAAVVFDRKYRNVELAILNSSLVVRSCEFGDILNSVNADSLAWFMQKLEDFGTRFAFNENRFEISQWIADQFKRMGYTTVEQDSFYKEHNLGNTYQVNVVATEVGTAFPEQYIVIGAHHDSIITSDGIKYNESMLFAPGVDDNASGTAAVLEIARVIKAHNFQPRSTLRFITFAMEELGLHGAYHDAAKMLAEGKNIIAMVNHDMISHSPDTNWVFTIRNYPGADFLTSMALLHADAFGMNVYTTEDMINRSDSWAYHNAGYPAIFFYEGVTTPHYHLDTDVMLNVCPQYAQQFTKLSASLVLELSSIPDMPKNFRLSNLGDGESVLVEWSPLIYDFVSYTLFVRNMETQETDEFTTSDSFYLLENLCEDIEYEITLYAVYDGTYSIGQHRYITPSTPESDITTPVGVLFEVTNYPNPFNPSTSIQLSVETQYATSVQIDIFNIKGQKVRGLVNDTFSSGRHTIVWNGLSDDGQPLASGVYFYRVIAGDTVQTKKMLLMK